MTLAERGAAFLNARMKASAGLAVFYTPRGTDALHALTAWTGTPGLDEATTPVKGDGAAKLTTRERDYLIVLADLIGVTPDGRMPVEGDRITETFGATEFVGGTAYTFEACKRGAEPCWRFSDRERTRVRVHTKPVVTTGA